ncbi:MAG: hypothetical protein ACRDO2_15175 [Nocardioidaceae bacterium]
MVGRDSIEVPPGSTWVRDPPWVLCHSTTGGPRPPPLAGRIATGRLANGARAALRSDISAEYFALVDLVAGFGGRLRGRSLSSQRGGTGRLAGVEPRID